MTAHRDLVVPCEDGGHRVRLRGGLRFFARAGCPRCRAPVDPLRWRRIVRFGTGLLRPRSAQPLDRGVWLVALLTTAGVLLGTLVFRLTADLWWPATVLLYGPRWIVFVPLLFVLGLAAWRDRAMLVPLSLAGAIGVWPLVGFRVNPGRMLIGVDSSDLRVATLNARGGRVTHGPRELADLLGVDVLMVQECGRRYARALREIEEWHASVRGSLCALSRYPIADVRMMDGADLRAVGGSALAATFAIETSAGPVSVTNVHLETPRDGFELILRGRIGEGAEMLRQKSLLREIELRRTERWADSTAAPRLVVGDFNTPPESRLLRRYWSGWTDAFAARGFGVGGTRLNGWIRPRIDYVMADDSWTVVRAATGPDVGSDHLPVVVVLRRRVRP